MATKEEKYQTVLKQAQALVNDEPSLLANMANLTSLLHYEFGFWWTGFYMVEEQELVLGPFQGPVACTRIGKGKGVCGTAWESNQAQVVDDVHQFEGHIACSSESNSEVVVPIHQNGQVIGVFDVDSRNFGEFDQTDVKYIEKLLSLLWS